MLGVHSIKLTGYVVFVCLAFKLALLPSSAGNKLDAELVPPDITLPTGSVSTPPPSSAAPGPGNETPTTNSITNTTTPSAPSSGPAPPAVDPQKPDPLALIETDKGTIVIRLFRKLAPRTVASFIDISSTGFYNNSCFHRVEPGFCIQGGDPRADGSGVYFEPNGQIRLLSLETSPSLKHNTAGVVAMAHFPKNPDTASCQFYITLAPQPNLDGQYSIFGGVINGMDIVNKIVKGDKIKSISVREQ